MSNVVNFPSEIKYKVLFNLPKSKVIKINKEPQDDFDVQLEGRHGYAEVLALCLLYTLTLPTKCSV